MFWSLWTNRMEKKCRSWLECVCVIIIWLTTNILTHICSFFSLNVLSVLYLKDVKTFTLNCMSWSQNYIPKISSCVLFYIILKMPDSPNCVLLSFSPRGWCSSSCYTCLLYRLWISHNIRAKQENIFRCLLVWVYCSILLVHLQHWRNSIPFSSELGFLSYFIWCEAKFPHKLLGQSGKIIL